MFFSYFLSLITVACFHMTPNMYVITSHIKKNLWIVTHKIYVFRIFKTNKTLNGIPILPVPCVRKFLWDSNNSFQLYGQNGIINQLVEVWPSPSVFLETLLYSLICYQTWQCRVLWLNPNPNYLGPPINWPNIVSKHSQEYAGSRPIQSIKKSNKDGRHPEY